MSVIVDQDGSAVVVQESAVTIVQGSPLYVVAEEIGDGITVVTPQTEVQVLPISMNALVLPIEQTVSVITNAIGSSSGAKITVGSIAPTSPNVGDLWIME